MPTFAPLADQGATVGGDGCGSRGGPGYRLASGKCASWKNAGSSRRR